MFKNSNGWVDCLIQAGGCGETVEEIVRNSGIGSPLNKPPECPGEKSSVFTFLWLWPAGGCCSAARLLQGGCSLLAIIKCGNWSQVLCGHIHDKCHAGPRDTWHIVTRVMAECVSNIGHKFMVIFAQPERNASVWFMGNEGQGPCRGRPCHIWFPSLWLLSSYVNMFSFYDQLLLGWYYVGFISHCFIRTLIKIFSSHKTGWVHHLMVARYK